MAFYKYFAPLKKRLSIFLFSVIAGAIMFSSFVLERDIGVTNAINIFDQNTALFSASVKDLYQSVKLINTDTLSIIHARECLKQCRLQYKRISFFTSYFFPSETAIYNSAPKYEVEEPELELVEPMGLQQIEALLYDDNVLVHKNELLAQIDAVYTSANDLKSLLYNFKATDSQMLESLRMEMIRINALYISGYDAPLLKTGMLESLEANKMMLEVLMPYFKHNTLDSKILEQTLRSAIQYLATNNQFDTFNRMTYLKKYGLPMQQQLGAFIKKEKLELNTTAYLNYNAPNMFSRDFLKNMDTAVFKNQTSIAALGKKIFFDTGLSSNGKVSCGTCHRAEQFFNDGKVKSTSLMADSVLKRNTPTLLYAGKQHFQFWDGRAANLSEQIKTVIFNPLEMGGKPEMLVKNICGSARYSRSFKSLFPGSKTTQQHINDIALAIAVYVNSLNPLNSAFDRYINGDEKAMTADQVKGFNLFMGKAQCGTCHFVPYFNSLIPPFYNVSELEIIGTTRTDNLTKPLADDDPGRYDLYRIKYYKKAFKTPTVRNAQMTAPYMHNGAFRTLESVMDFYNKGGGAGLGINIPEQTLSSKPLNLSKQESEQVIQFINSLTDNPSV